MELWVTLKMGACCPKAKPSRSNSYTSDADPLIPGSNGDLTSNRQISNGPNDAASKDSDEKAIYTRIIDDTQSQVI